MKAYRLFLTVIMLYSAVPLQGRQATFDVRLSDGDKVFHEVVEIDVAKKTEIFHISSNKESEKAEVIYDFSKTLTMISMPEREVCYLSTLNDTIPRPKKMMKLFKKAPVDADNIDVQKVKINLETKELINDRSILSDVMKKACQKFPIYWIEPVAESVVITPHDPISKAGKVQDRRRRAACGSVCVVIDRVCIPTCGDASCFKCTENKICSPITC